MGEGGGLDTAYENLGSRVAGSVAADEKYVVRGLLDTSTFLYFYRVSKSNLHKPTTARCCAVYSFYIKMFPLARIKFIKIVFYRQLSTFFYKSSLDQ